MRLSINMASATIRKSVERGGLLRTMLRHVLVGLELKTGIVSLAVLPYAIRRIKQIKDWREALDFAFSNSLTAKLLFIKPIQIKWEIAQLLDMLDKIKPRTILEIGTAMGGTLFLFTRVASRDATIISVDLPSGYPKLRVPLYKSFALDGQKIYLIRRDSHDPHTLEEVERILGGERLDFLFIDGDHSYEGVKRDFEMYSPLVRKGGIIAFHDIVPDYYTRYGIRAASYTGGVPKFWREIRDAYRHSEIVRDWGQDGYGIGVIYIIV